MVVFKVLSTLMEVALDYDTLPPMVDLRRHFALDEEIDEDVPQVPPIGKNRASMYSQENPRGVITDMLGHITNEPGVATEEIKLDLALGKRYRS